MFNDSLESDGIQAAIQSEEQCLRDVLSFDYRLISSSYAPWFSCASMWKILVYIAMQWQRAEDGLKQSC